MTLKTKITIGLSSLLVAGLGTYAALLLTQQSTNKANATPAVVKAQQAKLASVTGATGASWQFTAANGVITAPNGTVFTPIGANVGSVNAFDWRGTAVGHAADAKAWGWNAIRLNLLASDQISWSYAKNNGYQGLLNHIDSIVKEYTDQGIVVMLEAHDNPNDSGVDRARTENDMVRFWKDTAAKYKANPYVWYNVINEPSFINDEWYAINDKLIAAVRGQGNTNPVVVDAPSWGQDVGSVDPWFTGSKFAYDPTMAPALAKKYGNVILSQHNYGAYDKYNSDQKLQGYIDTVKKTGLPLVFGEYGYTVDKSSTAGGFQPNYEGAMAVFNISVKNHVGSFWWHATHGDNYSLKKSGNAFYADGGNDKNLSEAGQKLWDMAHAYASSNPVPAPSTSPSTPPTTPTNPTPTPTPTPTPSTPTPAPNPTTPVSNGSLYFSSQSAFGVKLNNMKGKVASIVWDTGYSTPTITSDTFDWWSGEGKQTKAISVTVRDGSNNVVFSSALANPYAQQAKQSSSSGQWLDNGDSFIVKASNYPNNYKVVIKWVRNDGSEQSTEKSMYDIQSSCFWSGGGRSNVRQFSYIIKNSSGGDVFSSDAIKSPRY